MWITGTSTIGLFTLGGQDERKERRFWTRMFRSTSPKEILSPC